MGRTAFITGASRGIGRAIARRLAAEGWSVGIDYLQARDQALALEEELRGQGYQALAVQADVADREAITAAVTRVEMAFGPVSLLVNNAGTASQRQFQDIEEDFWRRIFAVNVDGAFHTIQAVLPHMLHEKAGSIVNISSIWGQRGASCESAYSATKAALIGLTRSLAMELAINPNTIQKAYAELERRGFTYTVKGRGSFVSAREEFLEYTQKEVADLLSISQSYISRLEKKILGKLRQKLEALV